MKQIQKGICMEVNNGRSVFMLENGQFVEGEPLGLIDIGEESSFYLIEKKSKLRIRPFIAPAIAAVAIIMLILAAVLPPGEAYAYVQVEVNPGVEIGIDEDNRVVSIRELNEDGLDLIEEIGEWENHSLQEILNRVLKLAQVETADELTITTVSEKSEAAISELVETTVLAVTAASKNNDINVLIKKASQEQRQQSVKENIPVGQLVKDAKNLSNHSNAQWKNSPGTHKQSEFPPADPKQDKQPNSSGSGKSGENGGNNQDVKNPPGQEIKNNAPGQIKKQEKPPTGQENNAPGQEKKKEHQNPVPKNKEPVQNEKKDKAPEQGRKDAPGQQKKSEENVNQKDMPSKNGEQGNNGSKSNNGNKENKGNGRQKE